MTATPWGFRDILPEEAQAREEIALTVKGCFREHHYLPVETPLLEDKGSLEEGGRIADTPFKLFDDDGRLLVVRPDNTLPIVRLVSTRMRAADLPLRLRYEAPVVRECQRNAGGSRQFTQLGFELIGAGDTAGDVEIVSLVAEAVRKLALPDARIIAGSVRPFKELLAACEDRELLPRPCAACTPTTLWASMPAWRQAPSPMPSRPPLASCRVYTVAPKCSTAWTRCWSRRYRRAAHARVTRSGRGPGSRGRSGAVLRLLHHELFRLLHGSGL